MNVASALTGGFAKDIHITQDTVNLGNQLMFMAIVVLEIPFNMALQRVSQSLTQEPERSARGIQSSGTKTNA